MTIAALCCLAAGGTPPRFGTAAPTPSVPAFGPGWVVLCQARKDTDQDGALSVRQNMHGTDGDQQAAYLALGDGAGKEIDDFLAASADGQALVILRKKKLVLVRPGSGVADLVLADADPAGEARPGGDAAPGFDEHGHLFYLGKRKGKPVAVVRDVAAGSEVVRPLGSDRVWSAQLDPGGAWIRLEVLPAGAPSYKKQISLPPRRCWTGMLGDVVSATGSPPLVRYLAVATGRIVEPRGEARVWRDHLLESEADGALTATTPDGTSRPFMPSGCSMVGPTLDEQQLLVRCGQELVQLGADGSDRVLATLPEALRALRVEAQTAPVGRHLLMSKKDLGDVVFDLVSKKTRELGKGSQRLVVARGERTLVTRDEDTLVLLDGPNEVVLGRVTPYGRHQVRGHFALVDPLVVDLDTGKVIGQAPTRQEVAVPGGAAMTTLVSEVYGLGDDGRLLVGWHQMGALQSAAQGPLEWTVPMTP